jgi:hypothetical protein
MIEGAINPQGGKRWNGDKEKKQNRSAEIYPFIAF